MWINIGDKVRSFDFPHHRDLTGSMACYIEGTVQPANSNFGPGHYAILVTRVVRGGVDCTQDFLSAAAFEEVPPMVFPPINGRTNFDGTLTDGVEVIS